MTEIRVLITDDDPLVRLALAHFVSLDPEMVVVGEAENGAQAIELIETLRPDVAMMDVNMPKMDGIEATSVIKERWPEVRVLAVTTLDTRDTVIPMLSAGAGGYVLKASAVDEIANAVRQAFEGESPLSPRIAALLVEHVREAGAFTGNGELAALSDRESQVLQKLSLGLSNGEIASSMHVSEGTVKAHLGSIMAKWQVRDRVQVLVTAARAGLINFS